MAQVKGGQIVPPAPNVCQSAEHTDIESLNAVSSAVEPHEFGVVAEIEL